MKKPKKSLKKLKLKRPKRPQLKLKSGDLGNLRLHRRAVSQEKKLSEAIHEAPAITTDTIADHREEVLSGARKYIYPLKHSKHHIVRISLGLFAAVVVVFLVVCGLSLYKFQDTSSFIYDVTRIIPFPVAKADGHYISYESYLFELRRNLHYYQIQQQANFNSTAGKYQLARLKQQAMNQVVENAYVTRLAATNHVSVSDQDVNNELTLVQSENRLGDNERVFKQVLSQFWGWNIADFKRELKEQMLAQAVVAKLDTPAEAKVKAALRQLKSGTDFATLASQQSDDSATKGSGGQYPGAITLSDRSVPPAITYQLFKLKPGQIAGPINTGYSLDIVKLIDTSGSSVHAAHIQFNLESIAKYVDPLQKAKPPKTYIHV